MLGGLLVSGLHLRARLRRAEFCDRAIEEVDLVVEIDDYSMLTQIVLQPRGEEVVIPLTASHSLRSSPSGSFTAFLKLPLPRVASANCRSW